MPRAGTAFIAFRGDFSTVNRQVSAYGKTLDRQLNRGTNAWQAATKKQTQTLQQLGRTARFAAGGVALLGGIAVAKSIGVAADFEQQVSRLGAVSDASAKQLATLKTQALAAGAATKFSALDAAAAQTELAKGGLSVQQIMGGGLKAALGLAAAGELELADASRIAVNAIKLFGLSGKDAGQVADAFATAANKTTADVGDFGLALAQGGAAAKAAGFSFTETVAALEALAEVGVKGSDAGTSLKTSLAQLAKPTAKSAAAMKQLGIDFFDAQGNMKPLTDIAALLQDRLGGLTKEQRLQAVTTIAGTDGMRTLLSLYEAGPDKIGRFEKGLQKQGTAADVAAKKQDNLRGKLENFRGSIETLQISVGTQVLPVLSKLAERATSVANTISKISTRKDLDFGEKVHLSLKAIDREFGPDLHKLDIPGKLAAAISFAVPKMAEAAAKLAPKVVGAFVHAWLNANVWGRLVIGGFLLQKLGGFAAFRALGAKTGGAYAAGFAATSAPALAATGAAGAAVGGAVGGRRPVGAPGFRSGAPVSQLGPRRGLVGRAGAGIAGAAVGGLPGIALTVALVLGPDAIKNLKKGIGESLHGDKTDMDIKLDDLVDQAAFAKLDEAVKKGRLGVTGLREEFAKLSRAQLSIGSRGQLLKDARGIDEIKSAFQALRHNSLVSVHAIGKTVDENAKRIRHSLGENTAAGRKALERNMDLADHAIADSLRHGWISGKTALEGIEHAFVVNSKGSKEVAQRNFGKAEDAIRDAVNSGKATADQGLAAINRLFRRYLAGFGLKGAAATFYMKEGARGTGTIPGSPDKTPVSGHKAQRGGLFQFGTPGAAGRDTIPAQIGRQKVAVGSGEVAAVINRHQLPVLNARLADFGGLPGFFKKVNREHSRARGGPVVDKAAGFARGGIVGMLAAARKLEKAHFPYVWGGGHQASPAPFGPVDCSGAVSFVLQHGGVRIPTMVSGALASAGKPGPGKVTVFANPTHTFMRIGSHYFGTSGSNPGGGAGWFDDPGSGYRAGFAQRHFDAGVVDVPKLPQLKVGGPDSPIKGGVQAGFERVRNTAQRSLRRAASFLGSPVGSGDTGDSGPGGAAANRKIGRRLAASMFGWKGAEWVALNKLWTGESGWQNVMNKAGSGATGIPQALPGSKMASEGADWRTNPVTQIRWGLKYIRDRYSSPSNAYAQWQARSPHWYAKGGLVGMVGDSLGVGTAPYLKGRLGGRLDARVLTGRSSASGIAALRGMLGKKFERYILDLGTNDPSAGALRSSITRADKMTGGRLLLVPTVNGPKAGSKNAAIHALAHGDIDVFEWAKRSKGLTGPDGIHAEGTAAYGKRAAMMAGALKAATRKHDRAKGADTKGAGKAAKGLTGDLTHGLRQTVRRARRAKDTPLKRTLAPFLAKLEKLGLPKRLNAKIKKLGGDHLKFSDFATNAGLLTVEGEDGTPTTLGVINGQNEVGWLAKDLDALFRMRNLLVDARDLIVNRRGQVARALKLAQTQVAKLGGKPRTPRGWRGLNPATDAVAKWNKQPVKKRVERKKEWERKRGRLGGDRHFDKDGTVKEVKPRQRRVFKALVPKLKGQQKLLNDGLHAPTDGVLAQLQTVQGYGPKQRLRSPWPIGTVFGGDILTQQLRLQELGAKPAVSPPEPSEKDTETADLWKQIAQQAIQRLDVQARQFDVLRNFPPFGGQFAIGGVVSGPAGTPRTAIVHGQEGVFTPDQMAAMGGQGDVNVHMHFKPGTEWLRQFVQVEVEHGTRKQARSGARVLPGQGGGRLR